MSLKEVPTLHPTSDEFKNPIEYLSSPQVSALGSLFGLLKIVPPEEFKPPLSINEHKFRFVPRLQKLKELNLLNRCRMFFHKQLRNFNRMYGTSGNGPHQEYATLYGKKIYYYDFFIECIKYSQNDASKHKANALFTLDIMNEEALWIHLVRKFKLQRAMLMNFYEEELEKYFTFLSNKPELSASLVEEQYPTSILQDHAVSEGENEDDDDDDDDSCLICHETEDPANTLLCDSCNKPYHRYCLSPPLSKIPRHTWCCNNCILGNGYYGFKDSSIEYSLEDFKDLSNDFDAHYFGSRGKPQDDINALEEEFWKLVDNTDNDIKINYGADIHNLRQGQVSGFPTKEYIPPSYRVAGPSKREYTEYVNHPMNLNNLPFNKKSLLNYLDVDISGMTIPWIYVGNTFSTFCWHVEDQYTLSANYQHYGATKKWYGIPAYCAVSFEKFMESLAPDLFAKQPDILHQLITLVSPFKLQEAGIECYTANQQPGEYIVTYPRVYHAGFNAGYNFNEAVNFTMASWLDYGVLAANDYKVNASKSSVFDVWLLMLTILESFKEVETNDVDLELVKKCLQLLKPRVEDEYAIQSTILDTLDIKPQKYENLSEKPGYEMSDQEKKEHEDGIACAKCKGFCTFAFVRHYEPLKKDTYSSYLPTPQTSPVMEEDNKRRSKRIKVMTDSEAYDISVYCVEDYLKLEPNTSKDQFFVLHELDEAKKLIQAADRKLAGSHVTLKQ